MLGVLYVYHVGLCFEASFSLSFGFVSFVFSEAVVKWVGCSCSSSEDPQKCYMCYPCTRRTIFVPKNRTRGRLLPGVSQSGPAIE